MPDVKVGQVWRRKSDGREVAVVRAVDQYEEPVGFITYRGLARMPSGAIRKGMLQTATLTLFRDRYDLVKELGDA